MILRPVNTYFRNIRGKISEYREDFFDAGDINMLKRRNSNFKSGSKR